jgi:hypothetical protein
LVRSNSNLKSRLQPRKSRRAAYRELMKGDK